MVVVDLCHMLVVWLDLGSKTTWLGPSVLDLLPSMDFLALYTTVCYITSSSPAVITMATTTPTKK